MGIRKNHFAIKNGTETFCGLTGGRVGETDDFVNYKNGRGYTVTSILREVNCEKCVDVLMEMARDLRQFRKEKMKRERALRYGDR